MEMAAFSRQITAHNSAWREKSDMWIKIHFLLSLSKKIIRKNREVD